MTAGYAVHWVTAFLDRPADQFEAAAGFWCAVTATTLSSRRGDNSEFATFLPATGDATLKLQAVGDASHGGHLDLEVSDLPAAVERALDLGATSIADRGTLQILRSPAGPAFCLVPIRCAGTRPPIPDTPGGRVIADQVALDVGPASLEVEAEFWAGLTGWQRLASVRDEFSVITSDGRLPIRLLLQRLGSEPAGGPRIHLDLACSDQAAAVAYHLSLGAQCLAERESWTVMSDPSGEPYCLTSRDPSTGRLTGR